ncbi:MAG: hypothetical protein MUP22_11325, partial [Desulfobacterales bacterium]|nr:hypothetical protein [Desulfobacterales bacterium]
MADTEFKIKSLDEFFEKLINTNVKKGLFGFRGHANESWVLKPSILRQPRERAIQMESALFREFLLQPNKMPYLMSRDPIE